MKRQILALTAISACLGMTSPALATSTGLNLQDEIISSHKIVDDGPDDGEVAKLVWNVDRLDQPGLPLDGSYRPLSKGFGSNVYVLSTGIARTPDLVMRLGEFKNFSTNDAPGQTDCQGAGTQAASVIAGTVHGVAWEAKVHDIRILDCEGRGSRKSIEEALTWLSAEANNPNSWVKPGVIFAGWGSATDGKIGDLYAQLGRQGFTVVTGMDNSARDCGKYDFMHVVASTDRKDRYARNNDGACADILAPGVDIQVTSPVAGPAPLNSGTMLAAAHVAGVHAIEFGYASGSDVVKRVNANAAPLNALDVAPGISTKIVQVPTFKPDEPVEDSIRYENRDAFTVPAFSSRSSRLEVPKQFDENTLWLDLNTSCFERLVVTVEAPNGESVRLRRGRSCNKWTGYRASNDTMPTNAPGTWKLHVRNALGFRPVTINKWGIETTKTG